MSPIIRELERRGLDYFVLHTGQHYSYEMDGAFFEQLELAAPKYNLGVGSGTHAEQTGRIMMGVEKVLLEEKPDVVLVQGDTNTVLAGALAACKLHVPVGHVEAGLRSFDRSMPEEINRVVADHVSDYLYAPTGGAVENLVREGIAGDKVLLSGNTVVDAIKQNIGIAERNKSTVEELLDDVREYFLVTLHRAENVDDEERLRSVVNGLVQVKEKFDCPVLFFVHPRTQKMVEEFGIDVDGLNLYSPIGYLEFLLLQKNAKVVLTDSGGIQEESCILGVPCVTLRDNTERPETVGVGANTLVGVDGGRMVDGVGLMLLRGRRWINPFGDGHSGEFIINHLVSLV